MVVSEVSLGESRGVTAQPFVEQLPFSRRHPVLWRLWRRKLGLVGLGVVVAVALAAIFAPWLAPHDPMAQELKQRFAGPGTEGYLLGADAFGRDILSRLIYGGRLSLVIGFSASIVALGFGVPLGMLSGYRGGWLDGLMMRIVDVLLAFPYILLAIVIVGALGPGLRNTLIAVSVTSIPFYLRIMRSAVLSVKGLTFVEAARAIGATDTHIMRTAILPAILPYVIVSFSISVGWLILEAAGLSFLGLGAQPPDAEWGSMLAEHRQYITIHPHTVYIPGFVILIVVIGLNLFGDALRDALDVTLKE
ncbi:MAG: peptide/nickel transport system permease protein [Thermomicrobiales bacterium]|jgi:peptide/nickel transport system permease protein|nr:peptide/nickel transport system permease protein [Thermomicrobiales bacterium]MEA2594052.1 peptide/nickel transport system permease protein [Thermomicrobiales bacterium]